MDDAARGASALISKDFLLAISHYTKALATNPGAVDYYIKRSTAYTRLSPADHASALKDAEVAVVLASKRGKRELLWQSQLRRGIALFGLERWADAQACFSWVAKLKKDEKTLKIWTIKVEGKLKGLNEGEESPKVTVKEIPEVEMPTEEVKKKAEKPEPKTVDDKAATGGEDTPDADAKPKAEGVETPASKIRHEWYQTQDNVVVTLFAKGVPKDKATVEIEPTSLTISFPMPGGSDFHFSVDPFHSTIDASASSSKIMSTKVEFTLRKSQPGKWPSLEGSEHAPPDNNDNDESSTTMKHAVPSASVNNAKSSTPSYPTSSKSGPKNWDKLATELTKKPKKKTTDGGDEGGDDGMDDYEGGDPVNGFFQTLYQHADPNTRRAMVKSFQESNGTSLSTNWDEVGKGPVETSPPDGMVAKKW